MPGQPPTPAHSGGNWKIFAIIGVVVLLLCCIGGVVGAIQFNKSSGGAAGSAKAGDCLKGKSIDDQSDRFQKADLKVVKCSDKEAKYEVVGKVKDKTQLQAQTDNKVCDAFPTATKLYWEGRSGQKGVVLCLKDAVK